jgi:hypothetical protein
MADSVSDDSRSTDVGDPGRSGDLLFYACKISGDRSRRRVTHAWPGVATLLNILVPSLRH